MRQRSLTFFYPRVSFTFEATSSAEETEKNIRILNAVEEILLREIDHRITETQDLAIRLEQAIQRHAAQKQKHGAWKGTNPSENSGPRYRRPGV